MSAAPIIASAVAPLAYEALWGDDIPKGALKAGARARRLVRGIASGETPLVDAAGTPYPRAGRADVVGRARPSFAGRPLDGYTYDDCAAFTGDAHAWEPVWNGGRTIGALTGQVIRLEVELFNGRLYALRGDLRPTSPHGLRTWKETGEPPATLQEA